MTLSRVNFPSLEVLHLDKVRLPDINCLAMLLSGCALLEMLVLARLGMNNNGLMQEIIKPNRLVTASHCSSLSGAFGSCLMSFLMQSMWSPSATLHAIWSPDVDNIPMFDNLTHLECYADGWTRIMNCLRNFPKLQNLVVFKV
ncbi:hypothetical protein K1719_016215 [Acacia pycnantha]|nr:hypothetical protein K1719_016215 [Acacia pycnantha]